MVEMTETSNILRNCTSRSLVILDEIGRGTSTYDGVAIAWSVAEYLLSQKGQQAKTLFATHYHELTSLSDLFPKAKNFKVAVDEENDQVTFLHKIVPGGADKSYGIHVAKLAGLPPLVIQKAKEKLKELQELKPSKSPSKKGEEQTSMQNQLFLFPRENQETEKILQEIKGLDLNTLAPVEVFQYVLQWQKKILL
jgi:DNA mismatch repair protein MutS